MADNINQNKAFDIIDMSIKNGIGLSESLKVVRPGDKLILQPPAYYDQYSNIKNPDNPNAPTRQEIAVMYKQAVGLKSLYDKGAYIEQRSNPSEAFINKSFGVKPSMKIMPAPSHAQTPTVKSFLLDDAAQIMSDNAFAYQNTHYKDLTPDGQLIDVEKKPGWELTGKFVFAPDPSTNGQTKMLLKLKDTDSTDGMEQLRTTWGMPSDYSRAWLGESLKNVISSIPRLIGSAGNLTGAFVQGATYEESANEIFEQPDKMNEYQARLWKNIHNETDKKIFNDALVTNDQGKIKNVFQYLEEKEDTPIWERNKLKQMRMSDAWVERDKAFDAFTDHADALQNMTPESYKKFDIKNFGNVFYHAAGTIADLALQVGLGALTGGATAGLSAGTAATTRIVSAGAIGAFQAVGANVKQLKDAGFDDATIASIAAVELPAIAITESLAGMSWMYKGMPGEVLGEYFEGMGKLAREAYAKTGGKLKAGEANKLAMEATKGLWKQKSFRAWMEGKSVAGSIFKPMATEVVQENAENVYYNFVNLVTEKIGREDYYGDQITTGANTENWLYGEKSLLDPKEIFETTVLTAIATGAVNISSSAAQGQYSKEYREKHKDLMRQSWAAEQAAEGNLDMFIQKAKQEYKSSDPMNVFGSREDKLTDIGADNIVLDAEQSKRYADYFNKTPDGQIVIDNMADANYFGFLQNTIAVRDVAAKYGIDGQSLNAKMLHQIYDVNNKLLSTRAIEQGVAMDTKTQEIQALQDLIDSDEAQNTEANQQALTEAKNAHAQAKANMDYLLNPEKGTAYSPAVNDEVKQLLTTYNIANEQAKELLGDKYNPDDKKTFDKVKELWVTTAATNQSYDRFKLLINVFDNKRQEDVRAKQREMEQVGSFDTKSITDVLETATSTVKEMTSKTDSEFLDGWRKMATEKIPGMMKSIDDALNAGLASPEQHSEMVSKYNTMYKAATDRLSGIKNSENMSTENITAMQNSEDVFLQGVAEAAEGAPGQPVDFKNIEGYAEFAKKRGSKKKLEELQRQVNEYKNYSSVLDTNIYVKGNDLLTPTDMSAETHQGKVAERKAELQAEIDNMPDLNHYMQQHLQEMDKVFKEASEMYSGDKVVTDPTILQDHLEAYSLDRELLSSAYAVSNRLNGKKEFVNHSTKDEQGVVASMSTEKNKAQAEELLQRIKTNYDKFLKASGLESMISIKGQHHAKAVMLNGTVSNLRFLNSLKLNLSTPLISPDQMNRLDAFDMNREMFNRRGDYTPEQLEQMEDVEKVVMDVIENVRKNRTTIFTDDNMSQILEPLGRAMTQGKDMSVAMSVRHLSGLIGFDGDFIVDDIVSNDVSLLRYTASHASFDELNRDIRHPGIEKIITEKLTSYTTMLMLMDSPISTVEMKAKRLTVKTPYTSTYEQVTNEEALVAFLSGSTMQEKIAAYEEKAYKQYKKDNSKLIIDNNVIENSAIVPGGFGVGKTAHVLPMTLRIMKDMGKLPGKIKLLSPSVELMASHKNEFKEFDNVEYDFTENLLNEQTFTVPEVWIIDEASLLENSMLDRIQAISKQSGGLLKIIFLGDMNQMMASGGIGNYPPIMSRTFKMPMLTEQFSSLSKILQGQGDFWRQVLAANRMQDQILPVDKLYKLPKAYFEKIDGVLKGVHYTGSIQESYNNFVSSENSSKAIIFYNKEQYNAFKQVNTTTTEVDEKNIFFIDGEGDKKRIIQGLRRQEVYIAFNYQEMPVKPLRVFAAMYTAVGRASSFLSINMGDIAKDYNVSEARMADNIGDISNDNSAYMKKVQDMKEFQKNNLENILKGKITSATKGTVAPEAGTTSKSTGKKVNHTPSFETTQMMLEIVGTDGKTYNIKSIRDKKPDAQGRFAYELHMGDTRLGTKLLLKADLSNEELKAIVKDQLDMHLQAAELDKKFTNTPKPTPVVEKPAPVTPPVNDNTAVVPEIPVGQAFPEEYYEEPKPLIVQELNDEVFPGGPNRSQAERWDEYHSIYGTPYFVASPTDLTEKQLKTHRAMHTFIMRELYGGMGSTLNLIYHKTLRAAEGNNSFETYNDALVIHYNRIIPISKNDMAELAERAEPGYLKDELTRLSKLTVSKMNKELEQYFDVAVMAIPLLEPSRKGVASKVMVHSDETYEKQINDGFDFAIKNAVNDDERVILEQQRAAQIAIAEQRHKGSLLAATGTDVVDLGEIDSMYEEYYKVVYGEAEHAVRDMDIDFQEVHIGAFPVTTMGQSGEMNLFGTYHQVGQVDPMQSDFSITVRMPKMSDPAVKADIDQWQADDMTAFDIPSTTQSVQENPAAYSQLMVALRGSHLYQIIMGNRANLRKSKDFTEWNKLIQFTADSKDFNPKGDNQEEQLKNILELSRLVYGTARQSLYRPVERSFDAEGGKITSDWRTMRTRAVRVNQPHSYFTLPSTGNETSETPEINGFDEEPTSEDFFQTVGDDSWDTSKTSIKKFNKILSQMLGGKYTKTGMEFHNGLILHGGKLRTGMLSDGRMHIAAIGGMVRASTPYHETLHVVWNYLIDTDARQKYYELAQTECLQATGEMKSGLALEEWIASDFARKTLERKQAPLWDRFKTWLKELVDFTHSNRLTLEGLYRDIRKGYYADRMDMDNLKGDISVRYETEEAEDGGQELTDEELYDNSDRTTRFINLKASLPTDRMAVDDVALRAKFFITRWSPLGNGEFFVKDGIQAAISKERISAEKRSAHFADKKVYVTRNGETTQVAVSELKAEDYENILVDTSATDLQASKKEAKEFFINHYLYRKDNYDTILEHIMPTYDSTDNSFERGDVVRSSYSWNDMDPTSDGYTAMMKMQMETIPLLRNVNGKHTMDIRTARFANFKLANELVKQVGVDARAIYNKHKHEQGYTLMTAFKQALDAAINSNGKEIDRAGRYLSENTAVLMGFKHKFIDGVFEDTSTKVDNQMMAMMLRANTLAEKGQESPLTVDQAYRQDTIEKFINAFLAVSTGYILNNNGKVGVSGNAGKGFKYSFTEYGSDMHQTKKVHLIDSMNAKLNDGAFTSTGKIETFNNTVNVKADGTIFYGRNSKNKKQSKEFIRRTTDSKGHVSYSFAEMDNETILQYITGVSGMLGITRNIIPTYIMRRMVEASDTKKGWDMMPILKKFAGSGMGKAVDKAFASPREFLAAYLAANIYAYDQQVKSFNFRYTFTDEAGKNHSYYRSETLNGHMQAMSRMMPVIGENGQEANYSINSVEGRENTIDENDYQHLILTAEDIYSELALSANNPSAQYVREFMELTGTIDAMYDGSIFSEMGMKIGIPSQFYSSINMIAAEATAALGQATGSSIFRPDGKRQYMLQMANKYNDVMSGMRDKLTVVQGRLDAMTAEEKKASPLYGADGKVLIPYLREEGLRLDHIIDAFGMERDYGSFKRGTTKYTTLDYMVASVNTFFDKILSTKISNQIIVTPLMTISDSGKLMLTAHHAATPLVLHDGHTMRCNWGEVFSQVAVQAERIDRQINLSYGRYTDFVRDLNTRFKADGFAMPLPTEKKTGVKPFSHDQFKEASILDYAKGMSEEARAKLIDYVYASDLDKNTELKLNVTEDGTITMKIGSVASGNIKNVTDGLYNKANREFLLSNKNASEDVKEQFIKDMFADDYRRSVDYMDQMGFNANNGLTGNISSLGMQKTSVGLSMYGNTNMAVNEAMFAYYMSFHITNNAFDDVIGSTANFKDVFDKVKRSGAFLTPKLPIVVDSKSGGLFNGALTKNSPAVVIDDISLKVMVGDKELTMEKGTDGQAINSALWFRFYDKSSGGADYSVSGNGSMIKNLLAKHDMVTGQTYLLKLATKFITKSDFTENRAYYNMQMDLLRSQDEMLAANAEYQALVKGTAMEGYSVVDSFSKAYDQTDDFDAAIDKVYKDILNSQLLENGDQIYQALAGSVFSGYNTKNTRKVGIRQMNVYNPNPDAYRAPQSFATESMDNTEMGIILNAQQPTDASKPQSQAAQQEAFVGVNPAFRLSGPISKYGANPGVAISNIKQEIYDVQKRSIVRDISRTTPKADVKPGLSFDQVNWDDAAVFDRGAELDYALAQYEWYLRDTTRKGLIKSKVPGNFTEMLSTGDVTIQIPQMRVKMIQAIRNDINRQAIKPGFTGMRTVQATGMFHELYILDGDAMPFTRQDALKYVFGKDVPTGTERFSQATENRLREVFTVRGLQDMRIVNGETVHGEVVVPYIFTKEVDLREDESLRDLFTITAGDTHIMVKGMDEDTFKDTLTDKYYDINGDFFDSVLVRKAINNMLADKSYATRQELISAILNLDNSFAFEQLLTEAYNIMADVSQSMTMYANRVPSNRLGSGAMLDIVAIHHGGNEAFIPLGMALMNDSDFDIDQLAMYCKRLAENGLLSKEDMHKYEAMILDIFNQVYMAKENQSNLFVKSSNEDIKEVGEEDDAEPMAANTMYSSYKTYNDNKAGADSIGIIANTMSAVSWLQTMGDAVKGLPMNNQIRKIIADRGNIGLQSTVIRIGDWLQAALDNNKYNILGKYGITPEAVPLVAAMIAIGPKSGMTEKGFLTYIKEFFNDKEVQAILSDVAKGTSIHFKRTDYDLYTLILDRVAKLTAIKWSNTSQSTEEAVAAYEEYIPVLLAHANENLISDMGPIEELDMYRIEKVLNDSDEILIKFKELRKAKNSASYREKTEQSLLRLEELRQLTITSQALRGLSDVITLRNGIPAVDWDFYNKVKNIEASFGMSLSDYLKTDDLTGQASRRRYYDYFLANDNTYKKSKDLAIKEMLVDKAMQVYDALNVASVVRSVPMFNTYIKELSQQKNLMGSLFTIDHPVIGSLAQAFQERVGITRWEYNNQMTEFNNAVTEVALDSFFTTNYQGRLFHIALPMGENYVFDGNSIFRSLDMTNINDRQKFSLQMANFIESIQMDFVNGQQAEDYFAGFFPPNEVNTYKGMSSALFDANGLRRRNAFLDDLRQVGTGERRYVGLNIQPNQMTDDKRKILMGEFAKLPSGIQDLFMLNEIISNKLNFRAGSISDILGLKPYKDGVTDAFNKMADQIRNNRSPLVDNMDIMEKFMDYVATDSSAVTFVKETELYESTNPMYTKSKLFLNNRNSNIVTTFKKEGADRLPIVRISNRAGWSEKGEIISNVGVLSLSTEELEALYEKGTLSKYYLKGHNYESGPYRLDINTIVKVTANQSNGSIYMEIKDEAYMKEESEAFNKRIVAKMGKRLTVSINDRLTGAVKAEQGSEHIFDAISINGNRPFVVPEGVIPLVKKEMAFNSLHDAIIGIKYLYFKEFVKGMSGVPSISMTGEDMAKVYNTANKKMDEFLKDKQALTIKLRNNLGRIAPYLVARSYTGDYKHVAILRSNLTDQRKTTNEDLMLKKWLYSKVSYSEMLYNFDKTDQKTVIPIINMMSDGIQSENNDAVLAKKEALRLTTLAENKIKAKSQEDVDGYLEQLQKEWDATRGYTGLTATQQNEAEGDELLEKCN